MKKQLLLILGLMFSATIFAAPVTKEAAKKNAISFLQGRNGGRMFANPGMNQAQLTPVDYKVSGDAFYVFNVGKNGGFVITAADDRVATVLGYSYEGSFDPENVPENMKNWLNFYAKEINAVKEQNIPAPNKLYSNGTKRPYRHVIPMMLTCKWSQTAPYNDMCPQYSGDYERRPTGCVATAMAQVMYYHKWPKDAIGAIPAYEFYDDPGYGGNSSYRTVEGLDETTINWDLLEDEYNYNSTKESKKEVAKLMRYCGQALKMGYHPLASGAFTFDMPNALRKYLGYDKGVKYLDKAGYTTYDWEDIVYNEIANGRPVLYSGMSKGAGGHQFVCDGYENEYFHFNWGWAGVSDGYFVLTSLDPAQQGVGGNGLNFSDGQQIVIGVQPPVEGSVQPQNIPSIGFMALTKDYEGNLKKNNLGKVTLYVNTKFGFDSEKDAKLTLGYGIYDSNNNLVEVCKEFQKDFVTGGFPEDKVITGSFSISSETIATDGTFYMRAVVKDNNGKFVAVTGSDKVYFKIDVKGDDVTVTQYPLVNVAITNLRVDAPAYLGCKSILKATIENKGESFEGILYLTNEGKVDINQTLPVIFEKGDKKDVELSFYPLGDVEGEQNFGFAINGRQFADEISVFVKKSEAKSASLDIVPKINLKSEGNFFDIPVEITNKSAANAYKAPIRAILYIKSGAEFTEVASEIVPVEVEPSGKTTVNVHFDNLEFNKFYHLAFTFYQYSREKFFGGTDKNGNPAKTFSKYQTADALSYYDEFGNMEYKLIEEGETFDIPANACYVNLPKSISGRTINRSANPNCIYNVRPGVSTSQFTGCNLVKNDASAEINLNDAYSYMCLKSFYAGNINVTINVKNNMTTLFLPFEPVSVTCDGVDLKKANSVAEFETSDYALLPIVAEEADKVYCDFDPLYTSAPSILVVKKELIDKPIVFTGEKIKFDPTYNIVRGNFFHLHSSNTTSSFAEPIYGFGVKEFSKELRGASPFSVYLTSVGDTDVQKVAIIYPEGMFETGIEDIEADMTGKMVDVYTINGVKVRTVQYGDKMLEGMPAGIYIVNGKKFVK